MAKKKLPKKHLNKLSSLYEIKNGTLSRKTKFCPKCGAGVYLAVHKDRLYCGRCGYTEFTGKK